jgi:8-oxo-dGTP diphosphatase
MQDKKTPQLISKPALNPHVSIDCVVFGFDLEKLMVLTIQREADAKGKKLRLALPGDLILDTQDLDQNAHRILQELTGLKNIYLEQIGAFGDPNRTETKGDKDWLKFIRQEPSARVVTIAYYSLVQMSDSALNPSSFAKSAQWLPVYDIEELAFDHLEILQAGLNKLRNDIQAKPIGLHLLPRKFTITQLNLLYEAILNRKIDKRNFRRKIAKLGILDELTEKETAVAHKPSTYVQFNLKKYQKLLKAAQENFRF